MATICPFLAPSPFVMPRCHAVNETAGRTRGRPGRRVENHARHRASTVASVGKPLAKSWVNSSVPMRVSTPPRKTQEMFITIFISTLQQPFERRKSSNHLQSEREAAARTKTHQPGQTGEPRPEAAAERRLKVGSTALFGAEPYRRGARPQSSHLLAPYQSVPPAARPAGESRPSVVESSACPPHPSVPSICRRQYGGSQSPGSSPP